MSVNRAFHPENTNYTPIDHERAQKNWRKVKSYVKIFKLNRKRMPSITNTIKNLGKEGRLQEVMSVLQKEQENINNYKKAKEDDLEKEMKMKTKFEDFFPFCDESLWLCNELLTINIEQAEGFIKCADWSDKLIQRI